MKTAKILSLMALASVVTGCPHNEYTLELTPRDSGVDRKLTVYRINGTDTNGVPSYEDFPADELAQISGFYPKPTADAHGQKHTFFSTFHGATPADVGGAGAFTNVISSLGSAGFYVERFRGNDDAMGQVELKSQAADRVVDLILGWSEKELGNEPLYPNLRRFLDTEFRRDVKNLGLYGWLGSISTSFKPESDQAFMVRFVQYLVERNYIHWKDAPILFSFDSGKEDTALASLLQRFLAAKLAVANQTKVPAALNFVADPQALQRSWTGYLAGTDLYRAKLQQWEKQKELDPNLAKPEPSEVFDDCLGPLMDFSSVGQTDHLTVKLALPIAPTHSNGKWDAARKQVLWTSNLETRNGTNYLPVCCYAGWSQPSEAFQKEHLGRVALTGDNLLQYNFWRVTLNQQQAEEWEAMLKKSNSGANLKAALETFRFADESQTPGSSALGRELIATVLDEKPTAEAH